MLTSCSAVLIMGFIVKKPGLKAYIAFKLCSLLGVRSKAIPKIYIISYTFHQQKMFFLKKQEH